ncbi:MAG: hypothetical protein AAF434_17385 [Pseudomonadota bacterium]
MATAPHAMSTNDWIAYRQNVAECNHRYKILKEVASVESEDDIDEFIFDFIQTTFEKQGDRSRWAGVAEEGLCEGSTSLELLKKLRDDDDADFGMWAKKIMRTYLLRAAAESAAESIELF